MKHLKRIFEDKNFREINETILDECEMIQHFIDEFEEKGSVDIFITCGSFDNFRSGSLLEFKKYVNHNINDPIPSIQYVIRGSFKDNTDLLLSFVNSLKMGLQDTFCRFDGVNISDSHKYNEQFTRKVTGLKKNQRYESPYLITESHESSFSFQISNSKQRYFEANPELFKDNFR